MPTRPIQSETIVFRRLARAAVPVLVRASLALMGAAEHLASYARGHQKSAFDEVLADAARAYAVNTRGGRA